MKRFALVRDGVVAEVVEDIEAVQQPAPAALPDGYEASEQELAVRAEQQVLHDNFKPGPVPMEERFHPEFLAQFQVVQLPNASKATAGYLYDGTKFTAPPAYTPPPMTAEQALAQRDNLLSLAAIRIAPLQDAADMEEATPAEVAALKKWKQYRVAVNRIEQAPGFPGELAWPEIPT